MTRRPYLLAIACYLSIPVVVIGGGGLASLIDPEMARGHADYVRNYRLLEHVRTGVFASAGALALVLGALACYLVLKSRQRSAWWLLLGAGGPFGLIAITMLGDRAPVEGDAYQHFVRRMKMYWRVPFEAALFAAFVVVAFWIITLERELAIAYESFSTGTPVETIVERQLASSGMHAFGDALRELYLLGLAYLLWPLLFNFAGRLLRRSEGGQLAGHGPSRKGD